MSSAPSPTATLDGHDDANKRRLFLICLLAVVAQSMSFVLRSSIAQDIQTTLFDPIDPINSATLVGSALGVAFLGFAVTVALGSPLIDAIGMRTVLLLCGASFMAGTGLTIFADTLASGTGVYTMVWLGMLLSGVGWGCSEAVINPLTTTLYPDDKTHKLNVLHAWWPAGIIIGGLAGLAIGAFDLGWRVKFALVLLPATALIVLLLTSGRFPKTERAAAGIPASEMFRACLTPAFLLWFLAMFLTSSAELAPGQWVDMALTRTVGMSGIWLLVYVSGLMFVMRHFAGPMVHRLSVVGLLWVSCLLAAIGLFALSVANSPVTGFLAATLWGIGVCYMWPTMLAVASERFPRSGALGMGLIGTAGSLATYFLLPAMGRIFDTAKIEAAGGEAAFTALSGSALDNVLAQASAQSFRVVAFMPAILLIVFGLVWLNDRRKGGFKPEKL
ncbi:MAG: MFS transporter [Acidobacteria bacterium SCN 69-37]|nr:MAG: MFS transporter [Acidobacteria bacterium SCN 69-37]